METQKPIITKSNVHTTTNNMSSSTNSNQNTHINQNTSSRNYQQDTMNPYYIHPSDNPGLTVVTLITMEE